MERPLHIVSIPENSITKTISIDTNILDLYLSSGYDPDDFSVTHLNGIDVGVLDTDALTIDEAGKTIRGTIALRQRLNFERPIDKGENAADNDYEVALFRVMSETSSNDFKLIVRITDLVAEPQKLEILIDSFHLDELNEQRGIKELYLYEDKEVMDPLMGNDPNNFLTADLIESRSVWGNVDAASPTINLYDGDDSTSGFLTGTPVNNSSNTYHRLTLNFTEEVNIQKVGIRGRQIGGYYGFVFILRDSDDRIIYVHQASNPLSRGMGSDVNATSTYAFVVDYASFSTISDFGINIDNTFFDITENTTNVLLIDNFFVVSGYEYERGFVSIDPGADIDKFNTDNLVFIDNELRGLSFKSTPDAEMVSDENRDNTYEVGTLTITNIDGGRVAFDIPVRVVNVPSTLTLLSNEVKITVGSSQSTIISNLTVFVNSNDLTNSLSLGDATYYYELRGDDAIYFKIVGNALKSADNSGVANVNTGAFNDLRVVYTPEGGAESDAVDIKIRRAGWYNISHTNSYWPYFARGVNNELFLANNYISHSDGNRLIFNIGGINFKNSIINWNRSLGDVKFGAYFKSVTLANDDVVVINGSGHIWSSKNWNNQIWSSNSWRSVDGPRRHFQAVVLSNDDILVMGGDKETGNISGVRSSFRNDVWRSSDGGTNWSQIPASNHCPPRYAFQAVVLNNDDILVMGGLYPIYYLSDIWRSSDGGTNWNWVPQSGFGGRSGFSAVVFENNDILVIGGYGAPLGKEILLSSDGGTNWNNITPEPYWYYKEVTTTALVLEDDGFKTVLVTSLDTSDIWLGRIR